MGTHHHHEEVSGKNLFITILLNIVITLSQVIGGILSGSLALLSDALHNFSDVLSLIIAYAAHRMAARPKTVDKTYGYKRAEILAALFNASVLIGIGIFLIVEAFHKFLHPEVVESSWVIGLGILSILLNTLSVVLVREDSRHNMNIRAAYLHLMTDVMTSVAVVIGGVLMYAFQLFWIDPLVSILIALYLIRASFDLLRESLSILMQFTPEDIDLEELVHTIEADPQIDNVHHIHLWKLNDRSTYLEAHLDFTANLTLMESSRKIDQIEHLLRERFSISHMTFQCEFQREDDKAVIHNRTDA